MPIYEYRCGDCGHQFEKLIRNSGEIPAACPECGKKTLKKMFSSFTASVAGAFCKSADSCPSSGGGHKHSTGCGCGGGKCPF